MTISQAYSTFEVEYLLNKNRKKKTFTEYRGRLFGRSGLATIVGDINIEELSIEHIIQWKIYMRDEGLMPGYINDCLSSARWMLKWLTEEKKYSNILNWNQIKMEKEETNKPKVVLSPEEIDRLIALAPTLRDKAIIKLFFGTGIRSAEELNIDRPDWENARLTNETKVKSGLQVPVWEMYILGKNEKYRPICFYQDVKDIVDLYLNTRTDSYRPLFISQQNRRISYTMVNHMLHRVAERAGLTKKVTQHILRHSYTTDKAANGMPIPIISKQLGHANTAITEKIYTHINQSHVSNSFAEYASRRKLETLPSVI